MTIQEAFATSLVAYANHPLSAGNMAEDVVVDHFITEGWKVLRSATGSVADMKWKVDILAWKADGVVMAIQVKNNGGLTDGSPVYPHLPGWVLKTWKARGFKRVILAYANVIGEEIFMDMKEVKL